jgi:predicted DNA-binding transcriptional regulator YafY
MLPPLMFSEEEIEALVLGTQWVVDRADSRLALAARNALAKIAAVLPPELRQDMHDPALLIGPGEPIAAGDLELGEIRRAIRLERKLKIQYCDLKGQSTERMVWPFAIGFFDRTRVMVAYCELRKDIRHFRTDRITKLRVTDTTYPQRRQQLLKAWKEKQGISSPK